MERLEEPDDLILRLLDQTVGWFAAAYEAPNEAMGRLLTQIGSFFANLTPMQWLLLLLVLVCKFGR
jgi:hypothetical protein